MLPKTHLGTSLILGILTWLVGLTTPSQSFLILFGGVLIDTDHYIWYLYNKKDWSLKRAYKWHYALYIKREKKKFLHIFHTIESFLLITALGYFQPLFFYLLGGMAFHLLLDIIQAVNRRHYGKKISIIYILIKNAFS